MNTRRFVRRRIEELGYLTTTAKLVWLPSERETYYDKPTKTESSFASLFVIKSNKFLEILVKR
jgi:hypothetical protein